MAQQRWSLDADELRSHGPEPLTTPFDKRFAVARALPRVYLPTVFRMIVAQFSVAFALLFLFFAGRLLHRSQALPSLIFGTALVAFLLGLAFYLFRVFKRYQQEQARVHYPMLAVIPSPSLLKYLLAPAIGVPAFLTLAFLAFVWCQTRSQASWVLAIVALYVYFYLGPKPVYFYEQYWLAHQSVTAQERDSSARIVRRPHMWLLIALAYVAAFVPGATSTALALVMVCAIVLGFLAYSIWQLRQHGNPLDLGNYFLKRGGHLCRAYLDYEDVLALQAPQTDAMGNHAWIPPQDQFARRATFYALLISLELFLLVALSFYCPWEGFAETATPDELASASVQHHWSVWPFVLAMRSNPPSVALIRWVIAACLFVFLPPVLLLALYLRCLVAIEPLRQTILYRERSIR